ncbi:NADH:flavin oxidoreductase/NADH oxidase [Marisediminicola antarctica]|uniref:Oxidoreductase n=1 Tax=Marisediminicola antarctica TaxID=674079 RepID=A0A7L5AIB7_9MICO|nr:NADH:flavin oxidoreductase/NADH oxidase [Marisediminicola antarctica]QHO69525.1 oxidoreductase [Marisediminicola antarctica]
MSESTLFSPHTIRSVTVRNRIWVAPLCQYSVDREDGVPTDWHLVHLGSFARGGAGLVMTEATAVNAVGRISAEDTGIYTDEQRDGWSRIVGFIHSQGASAGIQLAHAGRKASVFREWGAESGTRPVGAGGWSTVAPSAVAFDGYDEPGALDRAGIDAIVADFARAARRSVEAGFDVVEIHAAHGYLVHQFLSPLSNRRDDGYGGSLENRARLLLEIIAAVRAEVGELVPILVRFSATDYTDGGWDVTQTTAVAEWARDAGADLFDISSGGLVAGAKIPIGPGYQVPFAAEVRRDAEVEVSAVGLITEAAQADDIIRSGRADVVMMGREIMRDPHFPLRAAHELGVPIDYWPVQYHRARPR